MKLLKSKPLFKHTILFSLFLTLSHFAFAQQTDSTKETSHFSAAVNVTNNGISLLPNFSLNKPAVIFNMAIGKKKLSFEPELRFAVEGGKPWSFLFWWRYKVVNTHKFSFNVGAHPAIAFREKTFITDGEPKTVLSAQRFLAGELSPNYSLTKNINVGVYYLHAFGLETDVTKNTDFFAIRSSFSNIKLTKNVALKIAPQFYYLKMDDKDGVYVSSTITLTHKKSPFFLSSIVSQTLKTEIAAKSDFVWNVSLHYAFSKNYVKQ